MTFSSGSCFHKFDYCHVRLVMSREGQGHRSPPEHIFRENSLYRHKLKQGTVIPPLLNRFYATPSYIFSLLTWHYLLYKTHKIIEPIAKLCS